MEKKQTALEFYREELNALVSFRETKFKTEQEIFEQAKQMEKEEIIKAAGHYFHEHERMTKNTLTPTQYYNETFGGNNE